MASRPQCVLIAAGSFDPMPPIGSEVSWFALLLFAAAVVLMQTGVNEIRLRFARRRESTAETHQALQEVLEQLHVSMDGEEPSAEIDASALATPMQAEINHVVRRVAREIQSREAAVAALKSAEAKYRRIFENAVEGIFQTTPGGRYLAANPALARLYGYDSPEQLIGELNDIGRKLYVDPESRRRFVEQIAEHGVVRGFEAQIHARDGRLVWISENARAVYDDAGMLSHYEGTVEDITQRKEAEDFQRQASVALAASEAKSEFLAKMSHEIRTPLNGVIGMLELLAATPVDARQGRYVRVARASAEALLSVVNDILDFSKIEAGKIELAAVDFDLVNLVEDAGEMFADRCSAKGLELVCSIGAATPSVVRGDPDRVRQILVNLLGNAVKFTHRGEIVLQAVAAPTDSGAEGVRLSVRDTGIGIPADRMDRLFRAFSQVDESTTRTYGGTGLGLAICHELAALMGGEMGVESRPGEGSTFWCDLPLAAGTSVAKSKAVPQELTAIRILAVDDNPTNLEVLREQCRAWGLDVDCTQFPYEALGRLDVADRARRPYGMILLDHNMPGLDGWSLAREIRRRESYRTTPLLMLSSSAAPENLPDDESSTISLCLTKPVRQSRLFDALVNLASEHPAADRPAATPPMSPQARIQRPDGRPARILVVEDNEINQMVVREILEQSGCRCEFAGDGDAAFRRMQESPFDVVLMDCQLPIRDGFQTTSDWRAHEASQQLSHQPIIALTANAIRGDRERCLAAGMDDYLTKPIDPAALIATIARMMEQFPQATVRPAAATPPAAKSTAAPFAPIDWTALMGRCLGNVGLAQATLQRFAARAPEVLQRTQEAIAANDRTQVRQLLHHLHGMASNVSAAEVTQAVQTLESCADVDDPAVLAAGVTALTALVDRVASAIAQPANEITLRCS